MRPATLFLTGVPHFVTLLDLSYELDRLCDTNDIGTFKVRDVVSDYRGKRVIALDFSSSFDAFIAQSRLDGYAHILPNGEDCVFNAKFEKRNMASRGVSRWRSSSPVGRPEIDSETFINAISVLPTMSEAVVKRAHTKLDAQLELLKKQKLVLQSQMDILEAKKKLQKEYSKYDIASVEKPSSLPRSLSRSRSKSNSREREVCSPNGLKTPDSQVRKQSESHKNTKIKSKRRSRSRKRSRSRSKCRRSCSKNRRSRSKSCRSGSTNRRPYSRNRRPYPKNRRSRSHHCRSHTRSRSREARERCGSRTRTRDSSRFRKWSPRSRARSPVRTLRSPNFPRKEDRTRSPNRIYTRRRPLFGKDSVSSSPSSEPYPRRLAIMPGPLESQAVIVKRCEADKDETVSKCPENNVIIIPKALTDAEKNVSIASMEKPISMPRSLSRSRSKSNSREREVCSPNALKTPDSQARKQSQSHKNTKIKSKRRSRSRKRSRSRSKCRRSRSKNRRSRSKSRRSGSTNRRPYTRNRRPYSRNRRAYPKNRRSRSHYCRSHTRSRSREARKRCGSRIRTRDSSRFREWSPRFPRNRSRSPNRIYTRRRPLFGKDSVSSSPSSGPYPRRLAIMPGPLESQAVIVKRRISATPTVMDYSSQSTVTNYRQDSSSGTLEADKDEIVSKCPENNIIIIPEALTDAEKNVTQQSEQAIEQVNNINSNLACEEIATVETNNGIPVKPTINLAEIPEAVEIKHGSSSEPLKHILDNAPSIDVDVNPIVNLEEIPQVIKDTKEIKDTNPTLLKPANKDSNVAEAVNLVSHPEVSEVIVVADPFLSKRPKFVLIIRKLMKEMAASIKKAKHDSKKMLFQSKFRYVLRRMLKELILGKGRMHRSEILRRFREKYPKEQDDDFARRVVEDIQTGKYGNLGPSEDELSDDHDGDDVVLVENYHETITIPDSDGESGAPQKTNGNGSRRGAWAEWARARGLTPNKSSPKVLAPKTLMPRVLIPYPTSMGPQSVTEVKTENNDIVPEFTDTEVESLLKCMENVQPGTHRQTDPCAGNETPHVTGITIMTSLSELLSLKNRKKESIKEKNEIKIEHNPLTEEYMKDDAQYYNPYKD